jgi:hypothetical protein
MSKNILIKKFSKLVISVIANPCLKEKSQLELIPLLPIAFLIVKHYRRLRRTLKGLPQDGNGWILHKTSTPLPFNKDQTNDTPFDKTPRDGQYLKAKLFSFR